MSSGLDVKAVGNLPRFKLNQNCHRGYPIERDLIRRNRPGGG